MRRTILRVLAVGWLIGGLTPAAPAQTTLLHDFVGGADDGAGPYSQVVLSGSKLFGMCHSGGGWNVGTVFSLDTDGSNYEILHHFSFGGPVDGQYPNGTLTVDGTTLYGMTSQGGTGGGGGVVVSMDTDGADFAVLHSFIGGADDGNHPQGDPILVGSRLYGVTWSGGDSNFGVVFAVDTDGSNFELLHEFAGDDGKYPQASVTAVGSKLYGVTSAGGADDMGVVFSLNTDGSDYTVLHSFTGADGQSPREVTVSGSKVYGMTARGGSNNGGVIYAMDTDGSNFTLFHHFVSGANDGYWPDGGLTLVGSTLYGATSGGGNQGVVFAVETDGTGFTLLHVFAGQPGDGARPGNGRLVVDGATIYGTTGIGGTTTNGGVVYSLPILPGACCQPDGSCQDVTDFDACASIGGDWQGHGTDCATANCPQLPGACCHPDGSCTEATAAECTAGGGTWEGAGTACDPNPCLATIIVEKQTNPDGWPDAFTINVSDQGGFSQDVVLSDGEQVTLQVPPGDYTCREEAPYGWEPGTSHTCPPGANCGAYAQCMGISASGFCVRLAASAYVQGLAGGETYSVVFTNNMILEFGDAPDSYGTLRASDGARHLWTYPVRLGADSDLDGDGQPTPAADGDDNGVSDDEDGVTFPNPLVAGSTVDIVVDGADNGGKLDAWIDFDANGVFDHPDEQVATSLDVVAGANTVPVTIPAGAVVGQTYARFRISTAGGLTPIGFAADGEVEDYQVEIHPPVLTGACCAADGTCSIQGEADCVTAGGTWHGAGTSCDPNPCLVQVIVAKQTDPAGWPGTFPISIVGQGGFSQDVNLGDGEQVVLNVPPGSYGCREAAPYGWVPDADIDCPPGHSVGNFLSCLEVTPDGLCAMPEVTTYVSDLVAGETVTITLTNTMRQDFGDAPDSYGTLSATDGARHLWTYPVRLGTTSDYEDDGQPTTAADGDDLSAPDDEDGVTFPNPLVAATTVDIEVDGGPSGGKLDAWIDFDANGAFDHPDEQIAASLDVVASANTVAVVIPAGAVLGQTYARFRLSTAGGLSPTGFAEDGEVEDYQVEIHTPTGTIIIEKQTDPDGAPDEFEFTGDLTGVIRDNEQIVAGNLSPGAYTAEELLPFDWELASIVCDDGNSSGDVGTATVNVQLEAGETVTCVFTNRYAPPDGKIVGWGDNASGQVDVPDPNQGFIAVDGGTSWAMGLKDGGSIVAWGLNQHGQGDVPAPNAAFVALSAGAYHALGVKNDGLIVSWGYNGSGQCDVPAPNADFTAVSAGANHSLGLKNDGTIAAWGRNWDGQCDLPVSNADFVAVAAGDSFSLALKSDGSIVAFGRNSAGQCNVPAPNADFVAIAAGNSHGLAVKNDGSIVAWGTNSAHQCDVPAPNTGFVSVAGGYGHSAGLKSDGSIVCWGSNGYGQCTVPAPNTDYVFLAAGYDTTLGIRKMAPTGACCLPDGSCVENAEATCTAAGGTWQGAGTPCSPNLCPTVLYTPVTYPGSFLTDARDIHGDSIVGMFQDGAGYHGFLNAGTNWTQLDHPDTDLMSMCSGIEIVGATTNIVGTYRDAAAHKHGYLYDGTTWTTLDADVPDLEHTSATGISGDRIVGGYELAGGARHGYLYDPTQPAGQQWTTLDYPGADGTFPQSIDGDHVVGYYEVGSTNHGFHVDLSVQPPVWTALDYPGADVSKTEAQGIDGAYIVGWYMVGTGGAGNVHGFLYDRGTQQWTQVDHPRAATTSIYGIHGGKMVGRHATTKRGGEQSFLAEFASACCLPDAPFCELLTEAECLATGGFWTLPYLGCAADDCNLNDIPDQCETAAGLADDCNLNWIPDDCEQCGDLDGDDDVDYDDYVIFLTAFGGVVDGDPWEDYCCDYDATGAVGMADYATWLECYRGFVGDPLAPPPRRPPLPVEFTPTLRPAQASPLQEQPVSVGLGNSRH